MDNKNKNFLCLSEEEKCFFDECFKCGVARKSETSIKKNLNMFLNKQY